MLPNFSEKTNALHSVFGFTLAVKMNVIIFSKCGILSLYGV
jgi:hypothetical protein